MNRESAECTSSDMLLISLLLSDLQTRAPECTSGEGPPTKQRLVEHV